MPESLSRRQVQELSHAKAALDNKTNASKYDLTIVFNHIYKVNN